MFSTVCVMLIIFWLPRKPNICVVGVGVALRSIKKCSIYYVIIINIILVILFIWGYIIYRYNLFGDTDFSALEYFMEAIDTLLQSGRGIEPQSEREKDRKRKRERGQIYIMNRWFHYECTTAAARISPIEMKSTKIHRHHHADHCIKCTYRH